MADPYRQSGKKFSFSQYQEVFDSLKIFPGDDKLYEKTFGYPIEVIDTGLGDKGITILVYVVERSVCLMNHDLQIINLVDSGIEAIINAQKLESEKVKKYYGLPVRKKI